MSPVDPTRTTVADERAAPGRAAGGDEPEPVTEHPTSNGPGTTPRPEPARPGNPASGATSDPAGRAAEATSGAALSLLRLDEAGPVAVAYERTLYRHWIDADGDCQDTRQEVLIEESTGAVAFEGKRSCKVGRGAWTCPYTGARVTDPRALDIDHVVPLANVHASGGHRWSAQRRAAYANALEPAETLVAVTAKVNRSRGAKGPDQWLPPNAAHRCPYVRDWIQIKVAWDLTATVRERAALEHYLQICEAGGVPDEPGPPTESRPVPASRPKDAASASGSATTLAAIKEAIVEASIQGYAGSCACPYHTMRNGRRCGGSSAYRRKGGEAPLCYVEDVTDAMVEAWRAAQEAYAPNQSS